MHEIDLASASLSLVGVITLLAAILGRHPRVMKWRWTEKGRAPASGPMD